MTFALQAQHPDNKPRFKPGWKTRKKETDINPWKERVAFEEGKAKEFEKYQEHKKTVLQERSSKYNPISGEFFSSDGKWEPATDPWAHIQSGKKLVQPSASSQEVSLSSPCIPPLLPANQANKSILMFHIPTRKTNIR